MRLDMGLFIISSIDGTIAPDAVTVTEIVPRWAVEIFRRFASMLVRIAFMAAKAATAATIITAAACNSFLRSFSCLSLLEIFLSISVDICFCILYSKYRAKSVKR